MVAPPVVEPVSLSELKEFLRVDGGDTSQDGVLTALSMAARTWAEAFLKRRLVEQTWRVELDYFPGYYAMITGQPGSTPVLTGPALLAGIRYAIVLPYPPVESIVNFQYQSANGQVTVMNPATDFIQDLQSNPARLTPPFGQMWPVARVILNAIQIDFKVGYARAILLGGPTGSPPDPNTVDAGSSYNFGAADIGRPISIPGAGLDGGTLNTIVTAVSSPPTSIARLRDPIVTTVQNQLALLVNLPNGNPQFWELTKTGIKFRVKADYDSLPAYLERAKDVLTPARDMRI